MAPGYFRQEDGHRLRGYHWQNQTVQSAVMWACGSKSIRIFTHDLHAHFWTETFGSPAAPRVIDPAKACLILKHQPDLPPCGGLPSHLLFNDLRQFF